MVDCGRTSATSRLSTMPSPPSTRPSDARERRSSAFIREDSGIAQRPRRCNSRAEKETLDVEHDLCVQRETSGTLVDKSPLHSKPSMSAIACSRQVTSLAQNEHAPT